MEELLNSIMNPNTVVSIVTSLAAFYSSYKMLEQRVKNLEKEVKDLNGEDIKIKIAEIQKDIQYIREIMDRKG